MVQEARPGTTKRESSQRSGSYLSSGSAWPAGGVEAVLLARGPTAGMQQLCDTLQLLSPSAGGGCLRAGGLEGGGAVRLGWGVSRWEAL